MARLGADFFSRDVLEVAPELLGKCISLNVADNILQYKITEVEAYRGEEDQACHARKGRTKRTEIMYASGGYIYVYLIYGMYWMLNFVCAGEGIPQAVLIRGVEGIPGPGKLTRKLGIDKSYYGESLSSSKRIWIEDTSEKINFLTSPRIGIDYAEEPWRSMPWRFILT